jgi:hypothetical protein
MYALLCLVGKRNVNSLVQGDSLARGPKQLPQKSICKYSVSLSIH